ncbi:MULTISPECIES: hypothetical protein [unclassified Microbacterium]|uniref:hypothetical protein n=1 Tax=unclassified Microbacterium TaxID=2609290 RepID=UPI00214B9024|nr:MULTISPECIES: hypothetical protein [unclassified Microbacterium]MCR2810518.1 hypothetical protein [Microbacterium sp. zg.B185]WIM19503.1 hypothetical protein QNO12_01445 [Microbacterium sp. zg-B185]
MSSKNRVLFGCALGAAALLAITGCGVTNQQAANDDEKEGAFYEGQKITLIVPFDAGGASDTFSRMFAGYLSEYLEGEPQIVVQNVPGGGQKEGLNTFERADHEDGLTLAMASGGIIASTLLDKEGVQFDPMDYETLVAFGGGMTIFGSVAAGITSLEDLTGQDATVFYGGMELNASESVRVFALDQLGIPSFKPLMGYDGGGSITTAVMRGELSAGNSTSSHYLNNVLPLEEDGDITPLMTQGYVKDGEVVRDPAFPDLPTMLEAFETLTGKSAEGTGWDVYRAVTTAQTNLLRNYWIHGDAPDEAKAALHAAVAKVVADPQFLEEAGKLLGEAPPVLLGEEANESLAAAMDMSSDQVKWVADYISEVSTR